VATAELAIVEVDPGTAAAASPISALDHELLGRYPGMPIHGIDAFAFRRSGGIFLIGILNHEAVACGALRPLSDGLGELKRMFVKKDHRGRGFGRAMLAALEDLGARRGYLAIRLETGVGQPAAIALYESAGYQPILCFGEYTSDSWSRCFEKRLSRPDPQPSQGASSLE
jgi:GNAT superfamily N-acetyltransferase